jgi:lysophospholipase L1-like esterase
MSVFRQARAVPRTIRIAALTLTLVPAVAVAGCSSTPTGSPAATTVPTATSPGSAGRDGGSGASSTTAPATPRSTTSSAAGAPAPSAAARLPDGPITIVTLGDSLTEGDGDNEERGGYPGRLQAAVEAKDRQGSEVVNLGLSGWSSTQLLEGQDSEPPQLPKAVDAITQATAQGRPVVALVLIGSNDLWYLYGNESPTTTEEEDEDLARYRSNVTKVTQALEAAGAVVVLGINDDQSKRPVAADDTMRRDAFPDISRDEVAKMSKQAERYATVIRDIASANDALVADFLHAPFFTDPALLADDGNHPNADGYDEMTKIWLTALQPLLG